MKLKFMVVDDDPVALQTVVDYLTTFGYTDIISAVDVEDAIRLLETNKIDFVISDWEMPGRTGMELLRMLKNDERFKSIPFIMITSPVSQERNKIEQAASSLVDGYVIKPFRSQTLKDKIDNVLKKLTTHGKKGVIVVDDDKLVRNTVVNYIKQMGYDPVYEADNGDDGLDLLMEHAGKIAFVVSDWEMPKLSGIEFLKSIRENVHLKNTPFIMITSESSIERTKLQQALESDVDNYLLKPFRIEDLKKKVSDVLTRSKAKEKSKKDLETAAGYIRQKEWEKALKLYRKVLSIDPYNAPAYLGLASAFEGAKSLDRAIGALNDALKHCFFNERIHYNLGRLYLKRGQNEHAERELLKALELKPFYKDAEKLLAESIGSTRKSAKGK